MCSGGELAFGGGVVGSQEEGRSAIEQATGIMALLGPLSVRCFRNRAWQRMWRKLCVVTTLTTPTFPQLNTSHKSWHKAQLNTSHKSWHKAQVSSV
ncbi:hypothetical protein Pmani_025138 [Petrolisthes manimaculis]|uniref:Uncharacterized protein n=1 Tax=Petrolisthes manimaculis TaxID=1843537 RepID=A0AAE1TZ90_9EUCA|nr:hypothetical protein Pmani_025138 [Petrolisthes manimaculis]